MEVVVEATETNKTETATVQQAAVVTTQPDPNVEVNNESGVSEGTKGIEEGGVEKQNHNPSEPKIAGASSNPKEPQTWGKKALSKISNGLGTPIYADDYTSNVARVSYAQVLVDMDVTKPPPKQIQVKIPREGLIDQVIEYDSEPKICEKCIQIGHNCATKTQAVPVAKPTRPVAPVHKAR
ncbi:uncharacterized protein LOC132044336 [Lycium ferocissimum]|uniref:uncharacterized protein LOC132044336 n=1 Tax=Lycium ferocissimum TaxID=112874 RepID=UPI0028158EFC|nr:uncharacterized protein LOC132044336 [Lycium ferocissimum]